MTTAYSTNLGLALPVQGELSGTWGDTVNNYITNYLDSAVAGTLTHSTDADVTLTTTNGSPLTSTSAQYAVINLTGARTAQRTITAPAHSKQYIVINSTTGGFATKIVGAGPTTGITVVAGETTIIAWNGSDFVKVALAGGSGTFTSINNTPIGPTTPSTGAFTTLSSNSTTTLGATSATSINSTPIGATTPSTGAFTSLSASGNVSSSAGYVTVADGNLFGFGASTTGISGSSASQAINVIINSTNRGAFSSTGLAVTGAVTATGGVDKLTTATGVVSIAAATAPNTGDVLTATSATTAVWQNPTPAGGGASVGSNLYLATNYGAL